MYEFLHMPLADPDYSDLMEIRHGAQEAPELHQAEWNGALLGCEIYVTGK
jgi:hypothetical protein